MVPREHELKIHQNALDELLSGSKTGEVRDCTDREFSVGDTIFLREIDSSKAYTGRTARRTVTHVQKHFGLPDNLCVLSYEQPAEQPCGHAGESSRAHEVSDLKSKYDSVLVQLDERNHQIQLFGNCLVDILVASGSITPGARPSELQLIQLGIEYRDKLNSE